MERMHIQGAKKGLYPSVKKGHNKKNLVLEGSVKTASLSIGNRFPSFQCTKGDSNESPKPSVQLVFSFYEHQHMAVSCSLGTVPPKFGDCTSQTHGWCKYVSIRISMCVMPYRELYKTIRETSASIFQSCIFYRKRSETLYAIETSRNKHSASHVPMTCWKILKQQLQPMSLLSVSYFSTKLTANIGGVSLHQFQHFNLHPYTPIKPIPAYMWWFAAGSLCFSGCLIQF